MRYACATRPQHRRASVCCPAPPLAALAPPILLGHTLRQAYPRAPTPSSTQCALPRPRRALRTSVRRAAPTPGPDSFLQDAPQALCTLTPPVAVVHRPSARRPAPTADCVPDLLRAPPHALAAAVVAPTRCALARPCMAHPHVARTRPPPAAVAPTQGTLAHPHPALFIFWALYCCSLSVLTDLVVLMHLCPLAGYLCTHGAPHLESLCLMRCDACAAHAPGALPLHPHVAQLSFPQLVRLFSTAPPAPALPHHTSIALAPPPPQASRPSTPSPPMHTLALEDASHPAVTAPADAVPLLARVFAPITHLELVSTNPVALAIEATKTGRWTTLRRAWLRRRSSAPRSVRARGSVTPSPRRVCTPSCALHPAAAAPVDTALLLAHVFALPRPRAPRHTPAARRAPRARRRGPCGARDRGSGDCACARGAPGRLQLERGAGAVDPAATGAALRALETVSVCGSPGPFALGAGADVGAVDPAATGATLQALIGARGCAARCVEAVYAGAALVHGGVPEQYLLGMHMLVFRRAEGDTDGDRHGSTYASYTPYVL
ncbi:hypothetical protein B0H14DRAFT_3732883 [Mycena olivaceomarginata]|nr:hypothetical protein B0H14DRAFT_3732883 [Mycena olivaceomarginata]